MICGFGTSVVCSPSKKIFDKKNSERRCARFNAGSGTRTQKAVTPTCFQDTPTTNYHKPANTCRLRILYFKVLEPAHRQMHGYGVVTALHIRSLYILKRLLVRSSVTTHHYA